MTNNKSYNSTTNTSDYRDHRQWVVIAQIFGTFFGVLGLIIGIYYLEQIDYNRLQLEQKTWLAIGYAAIAHSLWRAIATAYIIIRFARTSTDDELVANRYVLSALSLNIGGFLTPWLLTSLPNRSTQSTINSKWFLARVFSVLTTVGFAIFLGVLVWQLNRATGGTIANAFNQSNAAKDSLLGFVIVAGVFVVIGLLTIILYFNKNSKERFEGDTFTASIMKFFAYFYIIITTIELIILMIVSIIRMLGNIARTLSRMFNSQGIQAFLIFIFGMLNIFLQVWYVIYLQIMISSTIRGIWRRDGIVSIKYYDKLQEKEDQMAARVAR
ncbi:hypothetical protein [Mycoplasma putrefaciens]|uniref:Uncharacterized protein n=1 Tax=Mycoplasma putrefaciens (strain ATCC 15718 / NCTC 10155 / C30 KS-1 / KS-1) TaxID=743965 RepID=A0A7U3ZSB3_MYCPK|nr:hypothetical protein [Mycoplasma putrefaciens]AEM68600.1 uncharacterized protein MPUT_0208 [Mycoplasma putrefaciens KS1]